MKFKQINVFSKKNEFRWFLNLKKNIFLSSTASKTLCIHLSLSPHPRIPLLRNQYAPTISTPKTLLIWWLWFKTTIREEIWNNYSVDNCRRKLGTSKRKSVLGREGLNGCNVLGIGKTITSPFFTSVDPEVLIRSIKVDLFEIPVSEIHVKQFRVQQTSLTPKSNSQKY